MLPKLTKREKEVYLFISDFINLRGIPPTNREIAEHFNIASKNAFKYLSILEDKGYIKREKKISRGIFLTEKAEKKDVRAKEVPIVSYVAAGSPIDIAENAEDYYILDKKIFPHSNIFMFRVIGDSMIDAHIETGDIAVVSVGSEVMSNDIVVASLYNEITLKRLIKKDNLVILHPENKNYKDIIINELNSDEVKIIGKVVGIIRKVI